MSFRTLLVFIAILSAYSIHLLLRSAGVVGESGVDAAHVATESILHTHKHNVFVFSGIRAYEQLGMRAFGPPGKMLAACIITVHNIGGIVMKMC